MAVLLADSARRPLFVGAIQMSEIVARLIGPTSGQVALGDTTTGSVTLSDSSETVARRLIALPDRAESVGAMIVREGVHRMHVMCGDGGSTLCALCVPMLRRGRVLVDAGYEPWALIEGIRIGIDAARRAVASQATVPVSQDRLKIALEGTLGVGEVCAEVSRIVATLGPDIPIVVREGLQRSVSHEVRPGSLWPARLLASSVIESLCVLEDPLILVAESDIIDVNDALRILEIIQTEPGPLLVVAKSVSDEARSTLLAFAHRTGSPIVAVALGESVNTFEQLQDCAVSVGATLLSPMTGQGVRTAQLNALGYAQCVRVWRDQVEILGGAADGGVLAEHVGALRAQLARADGGDADQLTSKRLASLAGATVYLDIGGVDERERGHASQVAMRSSSLAREISRRGVVAGGGQALAHCVADLKCSPPSDPTVRAGYELVCRALGEPARRISMRDGPGGTCLGSSGSSAEVEEPRVSDVWDSAAVIDRALATAGSVVGSILSSDVLVLPRSPKVQLTP